MTSVYRTVINMLERLTPRRVFLFMYGCYATCKNPWNLVIGYGQWLTCFSHASVDRCHRPIPWFTYPAVEYLDGLDLSLMSVFEFGSGYSTRYWAERAQTVKSVEEDQGWAAILTPNLPSNGTLVVVESLERYAAVIHETTDLYDVIVIDGARRLDCARIAPSRLRIGGFIILDDADDHVEAAQVLRDAGLIEVDFAGFSPINSYTKTTSFFLHPSFRPVPRSGTMPRHSACHPMAAT